MKVELKAIYITIHMSQIFFLFSTDDTTLVTADIDLPSAHASIPPDYLWYKKLEQAQNVLFCKEVFAQVSLLLYISTYRFISHTSIDLFK